MSTEDEQQSRWFATHERMAACFREKRFCDAAELLENARANAIDQGNSDETAFYSGLLTSALVILGRHADALEASRLSEKLAPDQTSYKLRTVSMMLKHVSQPDEALHKIQHVLLSIAEDDPERYYATALLGQARLATGDAAGAIDTFRMITAPSMMERFERAGYAGVYDLGLVDALIRKGEIAIECRTYLQAVREVARKTGSTPVEDQVTSMIERLPRGTQQKD